jgi:autotransporter-associated beta strand protein
MNRHTNKLARLTQSVLTILAILLGVTGPAAHAQNVIYSDNFNIPDTSSLDGSSQTGRHTGLLANNVVGRSGGVQLSITGDELNIFKTGSGNDGRMRFCDVAHTDGNNRWDWASGTGGSTITSAGGMQIDFDWTAANNTSGDWVGYCVGIKPNSDTNLRVIDSGTASGIIFRNSGSATVFHNGTSGASANFNVSSLTRHVTLLYAFTSFADGSPVTLTAFVNGTQVMTQSFTWNANSGVQNMEIASYANGTQIDNFTVSSVAPPGAPSVVATVNPASGSHGQSFTVTATVTPGGGTVTDVSVDLSAIGGSASASLVLSNANVYTNTFTIQTGTPIGTANLIVSATDTTPLTGTAGVSFTVLPGSVVWNGGSTAGDTWSDSANWQGNVAPLPGDILTFDGTTRPTPDMNNNYSVSGLVFSNTAGSFTIGSSTGSTLTLSGSGSLVNNSANAQTINLPLADSGGGLTKTGNGLVTLAAANTYTGPMVVNGGTLSVSGSVAGSDITVASKAGNAALAVSGSLGSGANTMAVGTVNGAVGALWQTAGTISLGTGGALFGHLPGGYGYGRIDGGTFNMTELQFGTWGSSGGNGGNALFEVNGGTVTDTGWLCASRGNSAQTGVLNIFSGSLSFAGGGFINNWGGGQTTMINVMGGSLATTANNGIGFLNGTGIVNLNGGVATVHTINGGWGSPKGQVSFNGGTLQASGDNGNFLAVTTANIYGGGAIIDNNGHAITIAQPLLAPAGNGITSASVTSGGAGYIAPPIITITNATGDTTGTGATAIATIDPATGVVTNVIVTCPGVNYTATPVFAVSGGGATTPAVITGGAPAPNTSGALTSIGTGTTTLSGTSTYTGGTTVNAGTLSLATGGSAGCVRGALTINSGATVQLNASDALGNNAGISVTQVNVNGGTLNNNVGGNNSYLASWTLTGGTMSSTGGGAYHIIGGSGTITTLASANQSTISADVEIRSANTILSIDVAKGTAATDLVIAGVIKNDQYVTGGSNNGISKTGAGTLTLSGANTYTGNTAVNSGVLSLTSAFLADTSTVTVGASGVLNLNYTGTDIVGTLILDGATHTSGIYGAIGSGATHETALITGTGKIQVGTLSGYALWASTHGNQTPGEDYNNDGVKNGVKYFMGADGTSFTANPGVVDGKIAWPKGTGFVGTYGTNYVVQTSSDLIIWTDVSASDSNLSDGSPLVYTLPTGSDKLFVRLVVTP